MTNAELDNQPELNTFQNLIDDLQDPEKCNQLFIQGGVEFLQDSMYKLGEMKRASWLHPLHASCVFSLVLAGVILWLGCNPILAFGITILAAETIFVGLLFYLTNRDYLPRMLLILNDLRDRFSHDERYWHALEELKRVDPAVGKKVEHMVASVKGQASSKMQVQPESD